VVFFQAADERLTGGIDSFGSNQFDRKNVKIDVRKKRQGKGGGTQGGAEPCCERSEKVQDHHCGNK